jgi:molecular chaperone DnaK
MGQPARQEVNPDLCVAMGASIQAALIAGEDVGAVLVDLTPHSLGIRCLDYLHGIDFPFRFAPIIHRNTPLPASRSEMFTTVHDNQKEVEVEIYQGEHDDVRFNHKIGNFRITGLADVAMGNQLVVQCDLNLDGMLKVSAKEKATSLSKHVTIENALSRFEGGEIAEARERLDRLWDESAPADADDFDEDEEDFEDDGPIVPELVPGPREGQRETVQARALLEKAERLLEKVAPEDKVELERMLSAVRAAVTDRQWDKVTKACNELSDIMFYLEDV